MRKVFRISCESKIRENYSIMTPNYGSFKAGDSTRSRFLMRHAPPCDQRRGVDTQCHADAWPGLGSVLPSYAFFCGVEHGSLLGWSVSVAGWAVRLHAVFMRSFSRDRDRAGCAEIGSGNRTKPWLAPNKMGLIRSWSGCCECSPIHPWIDFGHSNLGSRTNLLPVQCSDNTPTTTPSERERKTGTGSRNTWGTRTSRGKYLRDKNFKGDRGHILWLTPHWGSLDDCLACIGYRKTSKGYLGPRRINVYCLNMARTLYSVMSHHEIVTTGTD